MRWLIVPIGRVLRVLVLLTLKLVGTWRRWWGRVPLVASPGSPSPHTRGTVRN